MSRSRHAHRSPHRALRAAPDAGAAPAPAESLLQRYQRVRGFSERLCEGMEAEDFVVQASPDASPTRWHLAHTTWFFETFVLQPYADDPRPVDPAYGYLFNSYYEGVGAQFPRAQRGALSRPTVREVFAYRRQVDEQVAALLASAGDRDDAGDLRHAILLGTHHEQQHQELMATDIKQAFAMNPLRPAWRAALDAAPAPAGAPALEWIGHPGGLVWIGSDGPGFHFDNESRRHQVYLEPYELASRLVTNAEYQAFMSDGGYERPELWLSMGWSAVRERRAAEDAAERLDKPLYWFRDGADWWQYTLAGPRRVQPDEPVVHVSYYEADAYARWAGARLPTEAEWEASAAGAEPREACFADALRFHPRPLAPDAAPGRLHQMFGDTWEWTSSAYAAYPGFAPWAGAAGEYNGKFMANQLVLRGGSCATPSDHIRASYRNFFYAGDRWQFMGLRLARDAR